MRRLTAPPYKTEELQEHVIWRLAKNGRLAEARMRIVPWGANGRPEFRMWGEHPTAAFQLMFSQVVATDDELDALARQQRQLFEAKGRHLDARGDERDR